MQWRATLFSLNAICLVMGSRDEWRAGDSTCSTMSAIYQLIAFITLHLCITRAQICVSINLRQEASARLLTVGVTFQPETVRDAASDQTHDHIYSFLWKQNHVYELTNTRALTSFPADVMP